MTLVHPRVNVTIIIPLLTVVSTGALTTITTVTNAPTLVGLAEILDKNDVLLPPLITMDIRRVLLASQWYHSNKHSPRCLLMFTPWVLVGVFLYQSWTSNSFPFILVLLQCLLSTFRFRCSYCFNQQEFNCLGWHHCNPLEYTHGMPMCLLVLVCALCCECIE